MWFDYRNNQRKLQSSIDLFQPIFFCNNGYNTIYINLKCCARMFILGTHAVKMNNMKTHA